MLGLADPHRLVVGAAPAGPGVLGAGQVVLHVHDVGEVVAGGPSRAGGGQVPLLLPEGVGDVAERAERLPVGVDQLGDVGGRGGVDGHDLRLRVAPGTTPLLQVGGSGDADGPGSGRPGAGA